jgi:hypothetical protein
MTIAPTIAVVSLTMLPLIELFARGIVPQGMRLTLALIIGKHLYKV